MIRLILLTSFVLVSHPILAFDPLLGVTLFPPKVECTVIEVIDSASVLGFRRFPKKFQSLNNRDLDEILYISGRGFPEAKIERIKQGPSFEEIVIQDGEDEIRIEFEGKPISRKGSLKHKGKLLGKLTCH